MAEAMRGATKAMSSMNRQMNLPQIQKIMMEFEKESELMDMKDEMMGDAIDDVMEEEDDEVESEEIVNKVLDEIGISLNQEVSMRMIGIVGDTHLFFFASSLLKHLQESNNRHPWQQPNVWLKRKADSRPTMLLYKLDWIICDGNDSIVSVSSYPFSLSHTHTHTLCYIQIK
jgi:hypothetical protein